MLAGCNEHNTLPIREYYTPDKTSARDATLGNPGAIEGGVAAVYANFYAVRKNDRRFPRNDFRISRDNAIGSTTAARTCR